MINGEHRHECWAPKDAEWERLPASIEDAAKKYAEDFFNPADVPAEVEMVPFHSMQIGLALVEHLVENELECILERLDEDHGDWETGNHAKPTPGMRSAAAKLAAAIHADYKVFWSEQCCDQTVAVALPLVDAKA